MEKVRTICFLAKYLRFCCLSFFLSIYPYIIFLSGIITDKTGDTLGYVGPALLVHVHAAATHHLFRKNLVINGQV